jgi:PadR family transcriptional regulator PadR
MNASERFSAIRKGLLEFAVLSVVDAHEAYAADILARLAGTEFATQEGTLYPLLSKLRRDGLVAYEWQESGNGPPRKYYRLTAKGRTALIDAAQYSKELISTLQSLGSPAGA